MLETAITRCRSSENGKTGSVQRRSTQTNPANAMAATRSNGVCAPPLLPSSANANTDASQYDVLGRRYYMNLSYQF